MSSVSSVSSTAAVPQRAPMARPSRATELSLVAMAVIWGINFPVMKYGATVLSPLVFNSLRMLLAAAVLLVIAYARPSRRADSADRWRLIGLGVLGHCFYQVLFVIGLSMTRAGTASLVIAASPAAVGIVARFRNHERLPIRAVAGIALSLSGVILVLGGTVTADGARHLFGDLLILVAVGIWAFYTTGLVPLTQRVGSADVAAWTLVGGVVPLTLIASPQMFRTDWGAVTALTWGAVFYAGILAMVVGYLVWYRGVREIGPTRTSMFGNLQPLVAVMMAWALLGEVPTIYQGVGAAAVIGGLYLARR